MDEKTPFAGSGSEQQPLYSEAHNTKRFRIILGCFLGFVVFNVVLAAILVAVMAGTRNGLFVLLLISLLSFAQLEFFLVFFIYRDHLPKKHLWSVFMVGVFVIIESIATDIIVSTLH